MGTMTITNVDNKGIIPPYKWYDVTVQFTGTYTTGGVARATGQGIGLDAIKRVTVSPQQGYNFDYDYTNDKVLFKSAGSVPVSITNSWENTAAGKASDSTTTDAASSPTNGAYILALSTALAIPTSRSVSDGVTTNASKTVTSATALFSASDVGRAIQTTNLPAGTTIASVQSLTSCTVSAAATATGTAQTLVISNPVINTRSVTDGATTNASTTLTSVAAKWTSADVGAIVSGTGIPANTTIKSVTNAANVVMSAAATATGTSVTVTISYATLRQFTDMVTTNSSTTVTSASGAQFTANDVGATITGTGIPGSTTISTVTNATTITISQAATATGTVTGTITAATTSFAASAPDFPRNLLLVLKNGSASTSSLVAGGLSVSGLDQMGNPLTVTLAYGTPLGVGTQVGNGKFRFARILGAFSQVNSVANDTAQPTSYQMSIGLGTKFGLYEPLQTASASDVKSAYFTASGTDTNVPTTGNVDTTYNTFDFGNNGGTPADLAAADTLTVQYNALAIGGTEIPNGTSVAVSGIKMRFEGFA